MKQALKYYFDITVDIEDNGQIGYFLYDKWLKGYWGIW